MKKGDWVDTPRFCKVQIEKVFRSAETARKHGFTEPTHYKGDEYGILGKPLDMYIMIFAAYKRYPT